MTEPRVFLDYTQAELDLAYDQRHWAPTMDTTLAAYVAASAATRKRLRDHAAIAYGSSPDEVLDVFPAATANAPILVFVHGGAWRRPMRTQNHFLAEAFVPPGVTFVTVGFAVIPAVRLPDMAAQVRRAIAWLS